MQMKRQVREGLEGSWAQELLSLRRRGVGVRYPPGNPEALWTPWPRAFRGGFIIEAWPMINSMSSLFSADEGGTESSKFYSCLLFLATRSHPGAKQELTRSHLAH